MSRQGVRTHHWRTAERGLQQGSLTHFSQCFPSGQYIRIALRTPCHLGEGSLHLAHANRPPSIRRDIAHSTRGRIQSGRHTTFSGYFTSEIPSADISHSDVSQPDGRGGRFNFPGQTCLDLLIVLTRRASTADNLDSRDNHFCTMQRNFS